MFQPQFHLYLATFSLKNTVCKVVVVCVFLMFLPVLRSAAESTSGVERLLLLLGEKPSSPSPSEGAACERVQQKAAVTLARLSRDPDVAQTAIQLKGFY